MLLENTLSIFTLFSRRQPLTANGITTKPFSVLFFFRHLKEGNILEILIKFGLRAKFISFQSKNNNFVDIRVSVCCINIIQKENKQHDSRKSHNQSFSESI